MTHVIFVTQLVDPQDPVLGNMPSLVRALAARAGSVTVIANEVRDASAVDDVARVISLGKERGAGRVARGAALERAVVEATRRRPAMLLAHMCPAYLVLAAPIARLRDVPSILWFAHPSITNALRVADRMASSVVTSLPGAYPLPSPKVQAIGQAIDVERFAFSEPERSNGLRLLALGRTSPSKGFMTIVRAVALARERGVAASLRIVGPSTTPQERVHRHELERELAHLDGAGTLDEPVAAPHVPALIRDADVLVNAMVAGSGDKVVFEAAAVGRPVLVSNPAFAPFLTELSMNLRFPPQDIEQLATRIEELAASTDDARLQVARELRSRVELGHSLDHWAAGVLRVAENLRWATC